MVRDIRAALPNSVRTTQSGGITALELLETLDGARYRDGPGGGVTSDADILTFNASSSGFNILGHFGNLTLPLTTTTDYLVIYNTGQTGANAYDIHAAPPTVITPSGTTISITAGTDEDHVSISPAFRFKYPSPYDRVYLVSGPVSWFCDPVSRHPPAREWLCHIRDRAGERERWQSGNEPGQCLHLHLHARNRRACGTRDPFPDTHEPR
ncbi:type II secretory pathway pseudopilin PulG [mine drainage metagenome]|uniref:Type II secretory pathway pseudopilin PulG n=1 Tax=mine drainage metagenome TaxID=410659 RepID=T1CK06_9ZZZZ